MVGRETFAEPTEANDSNAEAARMFAQLGIGIVDSTLPAQRMREDRPRVTPSQHQQAQQTGPGVRPVYVKSEGPDEIASAIVVVGIAVVSVGFGGLRYR